MGDPELMRDHPAPVDSGGRPVRMDRPNSIPGGVMVTHQVLVLAFQVRALAG